MQNFGSLLSIRGGTLQLDPPPCLFSFFSIFWQLQAHPNTSSRIKIVLRPTSLKIWSTYFVFLKNCSFSSFSISALFPSNDRLLLLFFFLSSALLIFTLSAGSSIYSSNESNFLFFLNLSWGILHFVNSCRCRPGSLLQFFCIFFLRLYRFQG